MIYKVIIAICLAVIAGWLAGPSAAIAGVTYLQIFNLIGQLFLNALSLVVVPLVAASIITGTARMGSEHSFGKLGGKVFGYFILTSFLAILVGLAAALIIEPGTTQQGTVMTADAGKLAEIKQQSESGLFQKIELILLKVIPSNILMAASQGQMLGLIVFCLFFGYFSSKIDTHAGEILLGFWKGVFQTMMKVTQLVMKALPIGVFGLVAKAIATTGFDTIGALAAYFGTVLLGLLVYAGIVLPLLLKCIAGVNPWLHIKAMVPALVTGFSTSSSAATLPVSIDCVEKRAGVSNKISSFILPLGTSVNLTGSALYVCVGVLFIAQAYGVALSVPSLCVVVFLTLITSLGSAGIPSASLFSIVVILHSLGFPAEGIGLIMAVERILDMFRTPVNIFGTSCCAVLVAKSEGEKEVLIAPPDRLVPGVKVNCSSKTVVVGMSGGVDSSVAALLLKQQGYRVIGLFMKNWEEQDDSGICQASKEYEDVVRVCEQIGIPYYSVNFTKKYWDSVFQEFLKEFERGRTPNPDILCNREIKFKAMHDKAMEYGADYLATGHYCQNRLEDGRHLLVKGEDPGKDQSYFLYTMQSAILEKVLFPVGGMQKSAVRELAKKHGLATSEKKDSTGICFIGERNFKQFLSQYLAAKPGDFVNLEGKVVGKHEGMAYYTRGQRKGMGIGGAGEAWYVIGKDVPANKVIVDQGAKHPALYCDELTASDLSWVGEPPDTPYNCRSKIRYRQPDQACRIASLKNGIAQVVFEVPQRAATPGQSIVFYDGEVCLGGGVIEEVGPSYYDRGLELPPVVSV